MKKLKKNNKGFSLVELIVVVLIIAIIAVALAPQVIKWVDQARKNTIKSNQATIKSAISTAVAEFMAAGHAIENGTEISVKGTEATCADNTALAEKINPVIADNKDTTYTYEYTVDADCGITTGYVKNGENTVTLD